MGEFRDAADGGLLRLDLRSIDGRHFRVLRPFIYIDATFPEPFLVPADPATFQTDLASVPSFFTWLVPRSGRFLPAAVLHDALVSPGDYIGPEISRAQADHVFRRASRDLGTGAVRSWLMWSAVTMATMWQAERPHWYWRGALVGFLLVVAALGVLATLDLAGVGPTTPWMGSGPAGMRLLGGAAGALIIPSVLALSWGPRFVRAGIIVGVALAFLLHVTLALILIYTGYWVLERLISGPSIDR